MIRTMPHDPSDPAEVSAIQTPDGQPDGALIDPSSVQLTDESSEQADDAWHTPRSIVRTASYTNLADIARRTGYPVVEVSGWKTRGRPGGMGIIQTITCHHTANGGARGNYPSLAVVRDGRSGLPGPLAQYGIGLDGTIYVIAAGKSNHAGVSLKTAYTNSHAIGIEAEAVGVPGTPGDWPPAQLDSYHRLCRALVQEFGLSISDVRAHKETCSPVGRKSDPDFAMGSFRTSVQNVSLASDPVGDDDMTPDEFVKNFPKAFATLTFKLETDSQVNAFNALGGTKKKNETISMYDLFVWGNLMERKSIKEMRDAFAAQKIQLDALTASINAIAANSSPAIRAAFDEGVSRLRTELADIDLHVTVDTDGE